MHHKKSFRFIISLGLLFIFVFSSLNNIIHAGIEIGQNDDKVTEVLNDVSIINDDVTYNPRNITPKNVSYHPSNEKFTIEWWYFEGIFDGGYNAVVNIILLSRNSIGVCISHLNIFLVNDTNNSFAKRTYTPINQFHGSEIFPDILIKGNKIIDFNQEEYNQSKKWIYDVTLEIEGNAVDLQFIGLSAGWEGATIGGYYGPVLPRAKVNGTIKIDNILMNVSGLGYHEHAHGISFPISEWGWYWGKIVGDNTSLFWGKMMDTRWDEQARAGVFSINNSSFININQENIEMMLMDYVFHSKRFIPTKFVFNISDIHNNIYVNVTMTTVNIYHLPIGLFNYWRYVLKINGEICYNGVKEELNNKTQIMELMRFR
ncbi:MAG: hypothetical protein DRN27_02045 [Thermoplasmata archaeon]|nr:MAG: hypothetical protein DRN27_02045 [Thermoplasmata archaeon]